MAEREDTLREIIEMAICVITSDKRLAGVTAKDAAEAIGEQIRLLWGGQPVYFKSQGGGHSDKVNTGDNFIADVTDAAADIFRQAGISEPHAKAAATDLAEQTRRLLSSQPVYIRKLDADYYTERDSAIRREFDGSRDKKRELCLKYGIGYHRLQQILNAAE